MEKISSYKDLKVWNVAVELCVETYGLTKKFPDEEKYNLISQIRRSAVSIPSNIAEGRYRGSKKDFLQFLRIAYSSGAELETQIEISKKIGFLDEKEYDKVDDLLLQVMKMLNVIIRKMQSSK